jgi:ubiquinone/menaquinone biosynthesis C-methylase UbiE
MTENGFFKFDDEHVTDIMGHPIHPSWWSRHYEYPWALQYAEAGLVVADMGAGWTPRPFKDALADLGCQVYAVDGDERLLALEKRPGIEFVVADMTKPIAAIPEGSLDRVFSISVLEDVGDKVPMALKEFYRCLRRGGLCVLTFDIQYNDDKPLGPYPGANYSGFSDAVFQAGFEWRDKIDLGKKKAVNHQEFNLCVFHCVLRKP